MTRKDEKEIMTATDDDEKDDDRKFVLTPAPLPQDLTLITTVPIAGDIKREKMKRLSMMEC